MPDYINNAVALAALLLLLVFIVTTAYEQYAYGGSGIVKLLRKVLYE